MPLIPRLVALAGLPGVGKSTAAEAIARELDAVVVSVDRIEDALHRAGLAPSFETGLAAYLAAEVVAREALRLGRAVVVDAANYVEPARAQWRSLAAESGAELQWVEVVCSDEGLHRERLGARDRGFGPSLEPSWDRVVVRRAETEPWSAGDRQRLSRIDSSLPLAPQLGPVCADRRPHTEGMTYAVVDLASKFALFSEQWSPKLVATLNDYEVKLARLQGNFVWHSHHDTDELFLVIEGTLTIQLRDGDVTVGPGQLFVVPRGAEHCPRADGEVKVLLVEPAGVVNTGEAGGALTARVEPI